METTAKFTKPLVETILRNPFRFKWSVQGLGMMRLYLTDAIRLHIWDSALKVPGVSPIHSHPWNLESHVVAGVYRQRRYVDPNKYASGREYNQVTIHCGSDAFQKEEPVKILLVEGSEEVYSEGAQYFQSKDEIHQSHADDGTVTIVQRTFFEDRDTAKVLWVGNGPWVDAKPRPATEEEILATTGRALDYWFGGLIFRPERSA